jgi:hypothetical protein
MGLHRSMVLSRYEWWAEEPECQKYDSHWFKQHSLLVYLLSTYSSIMRRWRNICQTETIFV